MNTYQSELDNEKRINESLQAQILQLQKQVEILSYEKSLLSEVESTTKYFKDKLYEDNVMLANENVTIRNRLNHAILILERG